MKEQNESKQQNKATYQTPDLVFAEVEPVWCDGSYDPIQGNNETPAIFM